MNLVVATEVAGLVVAMGGAGVVLQKGVRGMRRFARFLDGFLGDGTTRHPSVPDRLTALETTVSGMSDKLDRTAELIDDHVTTEVPTMMADGQAWGNRLEDAVAQLDSRVSALEQKTVSA